MLLTLKKINGKYPFPFQVRILHLRTSFATFNTTYDKYKLFLTNRCNVHFRPLDGDITPGVLFPLLIFHVKQTRSFPISEIHIIHGSYII